MILTLPKIQLFDVTHYVCVDKIKGYLTYKMPPGSVHFVLTNKSQTKLIGVIRKYQLCQFCSVDFFKDSKDPLEVVLSGQEALNVKIGTTLDKLLLEFKGIDYLAPYVRKVEVFKPHSPNMKKTL
ncbi:uncharacterized protein LOC117175893 [Belonocnema kinseyi]|uniref:uncharacterized protein LOC117175893 n=1 Tax=Belonocnema kinseyi TaxID=2817044 RepID=UPI00143D4CCF|nr:uncharacterized protein LOC117175893 [Belonocnema kinseyi]